MLKHLAAKRRGGPADFGLTPEQHDSIEGVASTVRRFGDEYWRDCEAEARFPREFHQAMAEGGWLGVTMPQEFGGAGLGVTAAALVMHGVARHGGGIGQDALDRAARYARERVMFGRPIGQNQAIQHPLAECGQRILSFIAGRVLGQPRSS
ncbi:acyl-CoA dehydrogenase family protein [Siccirubricoccus phaeus]|uniref:acyl-CoA dehydrogenase family protein n=1 Tax=Siccirubricoccus phaeus TaxID=2595053 RepID=UPI0011F1AE39|nr:acyl-CoA dehydrogenase family protein [Siccirubricoccus phaeus]